MSKKLKRLSAAAAALFDTYTSENDKAKSGRRHEDAARKAKTSFLEAMGDATRARLPDGRVVIRLTKTREMPAKEASTQEWSELHLE